MKPATTTVKTPLWYAAKNGHFEVLRILREAGAEIDHQDHDEWTPLAWAAKNGKLRVVGQLLDNGANCEIENRLGQKPLTLAAIEGYSEVVELLVKKGAKDAHEDNQKRQASLRWVAMKGHDEVVDTLLNEDVNPNSAECEGKGLAEQLLKQIVNVWHRHLGGAPLALAHLVYNGLTCPP